MSVFPGSIRIGVHDVRVEAVPTEQLGKRLGDWNVDPEDRRGPRIQIAAHLQPANSGSIMLHEILHAIAYEVGADGDGLAHEQWVSVASYGLATVLRDNPALVLWLLGELGIAEVVARLLTPEVGCPRREPVMAVDAGTVIGGGCGLRAAHGPRGPD